MKERENLFQGSLYIQRELEIILSNLLATDKIGFFHFNINRECLVHHLIQNFWPFILSYCIPRIIILSALAYMIKIGNFYTKFIQLVWSKKQNCTFPCRYISDTAPYIEILVSLFLCNTPRIVTLRIRVEYLRYISYQKLLCASFCLFRPLYVTKYKENFINCTLVYQ